MTQTTRETKTGTRKVAAITTVVAITPSMMMEEEEVPKRGTDSETRGRNRPTQTQDTPASSPGASEAPMESLG
jgi:hypothetical protein